MHMYVAGYDNYPLHSASPPQNVAIYGITASSFVMSWNPPATPNDFTEYTVQVDPLAPQYTRSNWLEVTGLGAGTTYDVRVGAVKPSSEAFSPFISITTLLLGKSYTTPTQGH